MKSERQTDVELWLAFERLDHAFLVRDDAAALRELELITQLRDEAAEAAFAPPVSSFVRQVLDRMDLAIDSLLQIDLVPALVRSTEPVATTHGDAVIGDEERDALGHDVEVSAVYNGVDLGVDLVGVDPQIEDRVRLLVAREGDLVPLPLISAAAGTGVLSATVPWSEDLPERVIVVVVQPD